ILRNPDLGLELRVGQQTRPEQARARNAEPRERRLQSRIAQERDLDRVIGVERRCEPGLNPSRGVRILIALDVAITRSVTDTLVNLFFYAGESGVVRRASSD